jgi:hypothetical protein
MQSKRRRDEPIAFRMKDVPSYFPEQGWNDQTFRSSAGLRLLHDAVSIQQRHRARGIRRYTLIWKKLFDQAFESIERDAMNAHRRAGGKAAVTFNPIGDQSMWGAAIATALNELGINATVQVTPVIEDVTTGIQDEATSIFYGRRPTKVEIARLKPRAKDIATQVTQITGTTRARLAKEIQRAIDDRLTIVETVRRLRDKFPQIATNRIPTIARTEIGRAADRATIETMRSGGTITHCSVVGCQAIEANSPTYRGIPTCNIQDVPMNDAMTLTFHPNHTGTIVPSRFEEPKRDTRPPTTPPPVVPPTRPPVVPPPITPPPKPPPPPPITPPVKPPVVPTIPRTAQTATPRPNYKDGRPVARVDDRDYMPDKQSNADPDLVQVSVDTKALDANWQRNPASYISAADDGILGYGKDAAGEIVRDAAGKPIKLSRKEWFKRWLKDNPNTPIETPIIQVDADGFIDFTNGRHRTSVLINDLEARSIIVTVRRSELDNVKTHLGGVEVPKLTPRPAPIASIGTGVVEDVADLVNVLSDEERLIQLQRKIARDVEAIHKRVLAAEESIASKLKPLELKKKLADEKLAAAVAKRDLIHKSKIKTLAEVIENETEETLAAYNKERKRWKDASDEYLDAFKKSTAATQAINDAKPKFIREILAEGLSDNTGDFKNVKISIRTGDKTKTPIFKKMKTDAVEFIDSISQKGHIRFSEIKIKRNSDRAFFRRDANASYANDYTKLVGEVHMNERSGTQMMVHEIMHGIEYANPKSIQNSHTFLTKKSGREFARFKKLKDIPELKNYSYRKDEVTLVKMDGSPLLNSGIDANTSHYAAKLYDQKGTETLILGKDIPEYDPSRFKSNEVMTMGTELLYQDAIAFAKADPEWFKFTLGNLRGQYIDDDIIKEALKAP